MEPPVADKLRARGIVVDEAALAELCRRYQVRELSLFGSVLRDDFHAASDIDVLVEFESEARPSLFTLSRLARELGELWGRPVDLGIKTTLKPLIREMVLAQARVVYAA